MHLALGQLDVKLTVQIGVWISEVRGKGCEDLQD